jgi:DNA-binding response OmpR family regulator
LIRKGSNVQTEDPIHILLVEDEPLISMMTAELLTDAGFAVKEAATAAAALTDLAQPFAAAVIDLGLPDRPGDGLVREVRQRWPGMPVVIASGRNSQEVAKDYAGDNKVACIGKPYDISVLLDALRSVGVPAPGA